MKKLSLFFIMLFVAMLFVNCESNSPTGSSSSKGIGVFSVGEGKTVTFSPGNLQYTQSTNTWSFASAQYEVLGTDNVVGGSVSSDQYGYSKSGTGLADKVDLFGWSTSATNFGVSTSKNDNDYSGSFVDWGTNKIGNDAPNIWRTLTKDEWVYLFHDRQNAENLIAYGTIEDIRGIIILPDNWSTPDGLNFVAESTNGMIWNESYYDNTSGGGNYSNVYNAIDWLLMEKNGAIFLPAAGVKEHGIANFAGHNGIYWSSTLYDNTNAYHVHFAWNYIRPQNYYYKSNGLSVRLVKDIEGGGATPDTPDTPTEPEEPDNTENGHEYVDLGLSVKWATCNVGATKPEEYGDYFAWGEVEPKEEYTLSNYKWSDGTYSGMSKYEMHSLTTLEKEDDVANIHWGSTWHIPTHLNWEELRTDCNWTLLTHNGIDGYKVTGPNGNSIFIPMGDYWSSSLYIEGSSSYLSYGHNSNLNSYGRWIYYRETGNSIRPVCE